MQGNKHTPFWPPKFTLVPEGDKQLKDTMGGHYKDLPRDQMFDIIKNVSRNLNSTPDWNTTEKYSLAYTYAIEGYRHHFIDIYLLYGDPRIGARSIWHTKEKSPPPHIYEEFIEFITEPWLNYSELQALDPGTILLEHLQFPSNSPDCIVLVKFMEYNPSVQSFKLSHRITGEPVCTHQRKLDKEHRLDPITFRSSNGRHLVRYRKPTEEELKIL